MLTGHNSEKFSDKSFISFLKVFLKDLIFRSAPVTRNPPQKLSLSDVPNATKGKKIYYKLNLDLTESNVFVTKSMSFEWEPDTRYTRNGNKGPTVNNQTIERLRCFLWQNDGNAKRDPTVKRAGNCENDTAFHRDSILGLTCCIRLHGKRFNVKKLKKYIPSEMYQYLFNNLIIDQSSSQILIDRISIVGLLWAITQMRKPFIFDSVSKSLFKEYFESSSPIEAQNLIYILALGKRLNLITPEKIEKSMQHLSSPELLNSISCNEWIIALSCMDNASYDIVTKLMNFVVNEIDGMDMTLSIVFLSTLVNMKALPQKYPLTYRKILSRIEMIFDNMPVDDTMSYLFHLLCQISCDIKGFFQSICTKVIRIMHLIPLSDMVKLMCAVAIYGRNCEKAGTKYRDTTRIQSFINLENYVIHKIDTNPPFPKDLLNLIHDSIIAGTSFANDEEISKLITRNRFYAVRDNNMINPHNYTRDIFMKKDSMEVENDRFELSSEERFFCANLLEDCCTNAEKLDSDVIMQLVYSLLTFKVDMAPLGRAIKRLVDESVMQEIKTEEMGFSVNLSHEMSDILCQYKIAESIISYAQRGKQVKDKFSFNDTQRQLEQSILGASSGVSAKQNNSSDKPTINTPTKPQESGKSVAKVKSKSLEKVDSTKLESGNAGHNDTHANTNDISHTVPTKNIKKQPIPTTKVKGTKLNERTKGKHTKTFSNGVLSHSSDNLIKRSSKKYLSENNRMETNDCKRNERDIFSQPDMRSNTSVSAVSVERLESVEMPTYNIKLSKSNDKLLSESLIKQSGLSKKGENVDIQNNPQLLFSRNDSTPIGQISLDAYPNYCNAGMNLPNNSYSGLPRHPQFSTHPQEKLENPYSLYPQYSTLNHQHQQQLLHLSHMQNQLQNQMYMLSHKKVNANPEYMLQRQYGNYPNYYQSNNMNTCQNTQESMLGQKELQQLKNQSVNESAPKVYNTCEPVNPHTNNLPHPLSTLYPNYDAFSQHYIDFPAPTQQPNNTYSRYDNDYFNNEQYPKPSSVVELKNQIHLLELEIERERLKELERKMTFINNQK